jgi:hypothetical protein
MEQESTTLATWRVYPLVPYMQKYIRDSNEKGLVNVVLDTLAQASLEQKFRLLAQGGWGLLGKDLQRLLAFLVYFVHPDGTVGGEYGSRATTHCFPYGLELLAAAGWSYAQWMLGHIRPAIEQGRMPSPLTVDDIYAAYFYINSFCQAGYVSRPLRPAQRLECIRNRFFPGAGLLGA